MDGFGQLPDLPLGQKAEWGGENCLAAPNFQDGAQGIPVLLANRRRMRIAVSFCSGSRKPQLIRMEMTGRL